MLDGIEDTGMVLAGALALAVFVGGIIWDIFERATGRVPKDEAGRIAGAKWTISFLWILCVICLAGWFGSGRTMAALFADRLDWVSALGWLLGAALLVMTMMQMRGINTSDATGQDLVEELSGGADIDRWQFESKSGFKWFQLVAISAGICEEVVFRAFAITLLALYMPLWLAAIVAGLIFILGHVYQGWAGMLCVAPAAAMLTAIWLMTGSLLPCIIVHVIGDLLGGQALRQVAEKQVVT